MNLRDRARPRPGDILVYKVVPQSSFKDKLIDWWEKITFQGFEGYIHVAMLDVTLENKFEATWPKYRHVPINWNDLGLELWRIKNFTADQRARMLTEAASYVGDWYGLGTGLLSVIKSKRLQVCTQYVVNCALAVQIDLEDGLQEEDDFILAPDDLVRSTYLDRIG